MEKFFWRENNANIYKGKCDIISPTPEELFDEIRNKFYEKLKMILVIFNQNERIAYLEKKGKSIPAGTPELIVEQKIGTRVIIDFLQLIKDMCSLKNIDFDYNVQITDTKDITLLYNDINKAISSLENNISINLLTIYVNVLYLINKLSLNYSMLEKERKVVEEKEGNFYNGKIVFK